MDKNQKGKVHAIIHSSAASAAAVGAGLAQIPSSDAPILVTIQTTMIVAIGAVFHKTVTESLAKSMLADFLGVTVGKTVANILIGWLPGIGNGINAVTAAGLTEAIGWAAAKEFDEGVVLIDDDGKERISDLLKQFPTSKKPENATKEKTKKSITSLFGRKK